eukprot:g9129.t1
MDDQPEAKPELLNWLSTGGGKILPDLRKQVFELRGRLGALARHPDEPPVAPSRVQETQRSLRPSIQSLARAPSSAEWEPQGGSSPSGVPVLQDRLWPREVLRGSSASSLGGSHSNAGAVRRLHSARSIESRARTATALLPVPPALDFGRMASQMGGAEEKETDMPPILSVLRAVLRRLALPDEAIRPRRAFLAAFACFGALRALAARLPEATHALAVLRRPRGRRWWIVCVLFLAYATVPPCWTRGGSDMVSLDDLHFDISVAVAWMLIGAVAFMMALFYLVNNSDPEIRTREVEG